MYVHVFASSTREDNTKKPKGSFHSQPFFHKRVVCYFGTVNFMFIYYFNFNFNLIQRALVLEDYAPALGVAGFVSRKKGARSKGKEEKEGKIIIIVGKMIIYVESREVKII